MKRLKYVAQGEHSECALACITMLLNYYGNQSTLVELREKYGVPKGGLTIKNIRTVFDEYGFDVSTFKSSFSNYLDLPTPVISYWNNQHFVVIEKIKKKKVLILDPASNKRWIDISEFKKIFSNILIYAHKKKAKKEGKRKQFFLKSFIFTKFKRYFFSLIILSFVSQLLLLLIPIATKYSIDNIRSFQEIPTYVLLLILTSFFSVLYVVQYLKSSVVAEFQYEFDFKLMFSYIDKLFSMPLMYFSNRSTGELVFRANLNIYIRQILSQKVITTLIDSLFLGIYLFLMVNYSILLTIIALVLISLIAFLSIINSHTIKRFVDKEIMEQGNVQRIITEAIEGIETIKSANAEKSFLLNWKNMFTSQLLITKNKNRYIAIFGILPEIIQSVMPALFLIIGIKLIINNSLSLGSLIGFVSIVTMVMKPILSLVSSYNDFLLLNVYFQKLSEVLTYEEKNNFNNKIGNVGKEEFIYRVNNVYYTISVFEKNILNGISFDIRKGDKVAIVGRSGSGKSTLIKLILGLLKPTEGTVYVNQFPLTQFNLEDYYEKVFYLSQDVPIFQGTLKENIVLNQEISDEQVIEAMYRFQLGELYERLPEGLNTIVSEKGMNFSGGEKQRIAFTRLAFTQAEILILDEATSALDEKTEEKVLQEVQKFTHNKLTILVTHRPKTLRFVDEIIDLNE
ncbi:peptidase domain-containing ABC transporter [Enterococcus faecalis]